MAALRWILLFAGLLFLGALAAWELRRPRQANRNASERSQRTEPGLGTFSEEPDAQTMVARAGRSRAAEPPLIDLPPMDFAPSPAVDRDESGADAAYEDDATPAGEGQAGEARSEGFDARQDLDARQGLETRPEPAEPAPAACAQGTGSALTAPLITPLIVDWPPDGERHILSLRIVAWGEDRLSGRVVRQSLAAAGFVHGRFGIFHQPGGDGRALLSAASLSKPGILDPDNMDFQRFPGISLFTVLPGALPPAAALEHLVDTAREVALRMRARVQDEEGQVLDTARVEVLRRTLQNLPISGLRAEPAA